jgi:pimeloyl-ACP methyl ester carboxylesterase
VTFDDENALDDEGSRKNTFEFMFHTKEKLGALHQPLLFTAWVNAVAGVSGCVLHYYGFHLYEGANGCSYWTNAPEVVSDWRQRKMPSSTRETKYGRGMDTRPVLCGGIDEHSVNEVKPIIFVHGLGVGLAPYLAHIIQLLKSKPGRKIAMLTLPHISMRAAPRVPELDDMVDTVVEITKKHALRAPAMYGHSFGTFVVARCCQRFDVRAVALLDPVAVCLCLPQTVGILYQLNKSWADFKMRIKEGPSTLISTSFWADIGALTYFFLRDYFLLREVGVMTALRRKFWWARYNLWADDLPKNSLIVLESNDLLIDGEAIARHVLRQSDARIIWQDKFVHGEFVTPWGYNLRKEIVTFLDDLPYYESETNNV